MAALESAEGTGALKAGSCVVVGKIVGIQADIVRFRVMNEAHGFDLSETVDKGFRYPVHAVHDTAIARKDDGEGEVAITNESGVFSDLPAGDGPGGVAGPVGFVEFANGGQRHKLPWQGRRDLDETVNVPGAKALR